MNPHRRLAKLLCLAVALVTPVFGVSVPPAAAHSDLATYYPAGWQERTIMYFFVGSSWTSIGDIANRARNGAQQWNNLNQGGFIFQDTGARSLFLDPCDNTAGNNGLFWQGLDGPGGYVGYTYTCVYQAAPGRLYSGNIVFDGSETNWYTGTGVPGSGKLDLYSHATHEFGHLTGGWVGYKHWDEAGQGTLCPVSSARETMCSWTPNGTTYARTLGTHDSHTFGGRY